MVRVDIWSNFWLMVRIVIHGQRGRIAGCESCVLRLAQASPAPVSVGSGPSIPPLYVDASSLPEVCFCCRSHPERGLLLADSYSTPMGQVLSKLEWGRHRPKDVEVYVQRIPAKPVAIRSAEHRAEYSVVEHADVAQLYLLAVDLRRCWMPAFTLPTVKAAWYFSCAELATPEQIDNQAPGVCILLGPLMRVPGISTIEQFPVTRHHDLSSKVFSRLKATTRKRRTRSAKSVRNRNPYYWMRVGRNHQNQEVQSRVSYAWKILHNINGMLAIMSLTVLRLLACDAAMRFVLQFYAKRNRRRSIRFALRALCAVATAEW